MKNKFIKLFNILIVLLYTCILCIDEDSLSCISNITDINPSKRKLLPVVSNFGNPQVNQIRATSNNIPNPYINTESSQIEINNNKQLSPFGHFDEFPYSRNSNYFRDDTRKKVNGIPFTLLHSLRLILANKIIRYNPILYPFQIEFQNISSCLCDLKLDEIGNQAPIDFKIKGHPEDNHHHHHQNINSSNLYSSYISLLPPNCQWNNIFNSTYGDLDNLASNDNSYFDPRNNNSKIKYTNLLSIEVNDNFVNDSLKVLESDLNNINKTNNIENITDMNNDIVIPKNETDDLYLNINNSNLDKSKEYKFHSKVLIESPDHLVQCIYRIPLDLTPFSKNYKYYNNNMVLNDSLANINTPLVENDNNKFNFLSSSWLNYLSPESPKWFEYDFTRDKNMEVFTDDNKYNKFTIEGYWDLIRSIPLQVLLSLNTSDPLTYIMCTNTSETLHNFLTDNINNTNSNNNNNNQDPLNNPNIFSLMSIVPYNESYCSRPTGAQLKMFGFCPSITNSKYDEELQSCIKITYADATSVCPQNYRHSRLGGSRNGGGGCHVKQRVDIPATKTCDFPYTYNEAKEICELKKYYPGFPGCSNGSTYYNLTTCILAYQILKEYECPDGYEALDDSDFNQENNPSEYNKRMGTLQEYRENYLHKYTNRSYSYNLPPITRIIDINEQGIQSRYPSLKLNNSKTHITCRKRIIEPCEYDDLGIPYCKNNIFKIKYDYIYSYMFEDRPIPQCIFDDIIKVEYKCPEESIPYEIHIANGNNPPIIFTKELGNPYDTCIITEFIPIQPKCITSDQTPYILIRPQLSPFEKTGIHIVTNEDIENLNPNELQEVYDIIDNSLFDENIDNNSINNLDKNENSKSITVASNNNPDHNNFTGNITKDHIFNKNCTKNNTMNKNKKNDINLFNVSSNIKEPINQINNTQFLYITQQNINSNQNCTSINLNHNKYIRVSKNDTFNSNIESSVNISDHYTNLSKSNILISQLPMEINKNSTTLISNINETNNEHQYKVLSNTSMLLDQELSPSYLFKLLNNIGNGDNFSNNQIEEPRIRLSDAILGNTDYIIQIYCSEVITAKPYLSCPQNSNLIKSNLCRLHGYTDYVLQCPDGYILDKEALMLMPVEYYRKVPPRCIGKQLVYTQYYCPPMFPDQIDRPFILNKTNYTNKSRNVDNYQINNISYILQDFEDQYINQSINKYNNNRISESSSLKNNTENIIGRTVIPSYSQKICHEVDIIEPIWKMPNLLILLLKNIKNFED
ncbi:hypothetical protein cand_024740 [Cryptosporidium andersoni]|uniref:Oocyst wall protein n=1 Tax=Cryptosporidium andersoni TaxID=117008 RepID=A0A1J4MV88_9CRYT|nr:hypothetical protein cand_024740 [Cryptosporidium andersoni]